VKPSEEPRVPLSQLLITTFLVMPCLASDDPGTIRGTVLNGSQGNAPVAGTEVILQVQQDGTFIPLAETPTDEHGRFVFDGLPVDGEILYLPGASRDGVYYPGERVRLDSQHREVTANVRVFDAVTDPSPLVARRHEIIIRPEPNLLNVTETILVSNPSSQSYVGGREGSRPVTLRLQVPSNFEKITFHKEFYGRRFALIDGVLMTTIPWPPGERELTFTYILPIERQHQLWERPLDLRCGDVRVRVVASNPTGITCNLPSGPTAVSGESVFEHRAESLPPGHAIRVEFGRLPLPLSAYARWIALGTLVMLIVAVTIVVLTKRILAMRGSTPEKQSCLSTCQTASSTGQPFEPRGRCRDANYRIPHR